MEETTAPLTCTRMMSLMGNNGDQKMSKQAIRSKTYLIGTLQAGTGAQQTCWGHISPKDGQCIVGQGLVTIRYSPLPRGMAGDVLPLERSPSECIQCQDMDTSAAGCLGNQGYGAGFALIINYLQRTNIRGIKGGRSVLDKHNIMPRFTTCVFELSLVGFELGTELYGIVNENWEWNGTDLR